MVEMTDAEVMAALRSDTPLNRARARFSHNAAAIEQAGLQRKPSGPVEVRRMEFKAVQEIGDILRTADQERIRLLEAVNRSSLVAMTIASTEEYDFSEAIAVANAALSSGGSHG